MMIGLMKFRWFAMACFASLVLVIHADAGAQVMPAPNPVEAEAPDMGMVLIDDHAVRYRIISRTPGDVEVRSTVKFYPTFGWFVINVEYEYGSQMKPRVVRWWLVGVTGGRMILSANVPNATSKASRRTDYKFIGLPRVGDRTEATLEVQYHFEVAARVRETLKFNLGFMEAEIWTYINGYSRGRISPWITAETQVWEVIEVIGPDGLPIEEKPGVLPGMSPAPGTVPQTGTIPMSVEPNPDQSSDPWGM